ncbi:hypothetical protein [Legionella clemsonensis]|uniref:Uncharacterized protein n=1 Tax=Legionella clemsonensis TaxID=1867846 RepID=A0A222NZT6_9GAMM|nr:hypothetical protein [Legionella clemsonensis]ASQ45086.1 hypothetical protein clem_02625 [Legionella clemsonensis]
MKKSSKKSSKDKARETVKKEDLKNISGGCHQDPYNRYRGGDVHDDNRYGHDDDNRYPYGKG